MTIKDFIEKKIAVALETPEQAKEFAKMIKPYNLKCDDGELAHEWIMEDVERLFDVGRKLGEPEISFSYNFEEYGIKGFAWCTLVNRNDPHYTEVGWKIVPFSEFEKPAKKYRCVGYKGNEKNFIVGHVYELDSDGHITCDNALGRPGKKYTYNWTNGEALIDWLSEWYEFEPVHEGDPKPAKYQIIIECDGNDITTAYFLVDGKIINSAKAKRNPEDKFDFRIGAEMAFNRLFGKEVKREFKVGEVVRIRKDLRMNEDEKESEYDGCFVTREMVTHKGQKAKIVKIGGTSGSFKNRYLIEIDGKKSLWNWSAEMFE